MNWKILAGLLFISISASAQLQVPQQWDDKSIKKFLDTKNIKCSLTHEELNRQIAFQIGIFKRQITDALLARGSEIQSITIEPPIKGVFPNVAVYHFEILAKFTVDIHNWKFHIQTSYQSAASAAPTVESGLWFPLTISNPEAKETCNLERVALPEHQREYLPAVDLVIGDPPRIVATRLVNVLNIAAASQPVKPPQAPAPAAPAKEPPPVKESPPTQQAKERAEEPKEEKKKYRSDRERRRAERRERREKRRAERRERQRERRYHRKRYRSEEPSAEDKDRATQQAECSGDISPWKQVYCGIKGKIESQ